MKGYRFWALALLAVLTCSAVIALMATDADGSTTYIDSSWFIDTDRTLSGGTLWVNGTVHVTSGTLRLRGAELVLDPRATSTGLVVHDGGHLDATDSILRGAASRVFLDIEDDSVLADCTLSRIAAVNHTGGLLRVERCALHDGGTFLSSRSHLQVRGCEFEEFTGSGVNWYYQYPSALQTTLLVEGSNFSSGDPAAVGVSIVGPGSNELDLRAIVRLCNFSGLMRAVVISAFGDYGEALVEGNRATDCVNGAMLNWVGSAVTLRDNEWVRTYQYPKTNIGLSVCSQVRHGVLVENDTISGFEIGVNYDISATGGTLYLLGVRIQGAEYGVNCHSAEVELNGSRVSASEYEFLLDGVCEVRLVNCVHSRLAGVLSPYAKLVEYQVVDFRSVSWQDGTPIRSGSTYIEAEDGRFLAEVDNACPGPTRVQTWMLTQGSEVDTGLAVGTFWESEVAFHSAPFCATGGRPMDLHIIDDHPPQLEVLAPVHDSLIAVNRIDVHGTYSEAGSGLRAIMVSLDAWPWERAACNQGDFHLTLLGIPDGAHIVRANITDVVGNSMEVYVRDVVTDDTVPTIEVLSPGHYVNVYEVHLVARTEPDARATVDGAEVEVGAGGMFEADVLMRSDAIVIEISVVDRVGHANSTRYSVELDLSPPELIVERPLDGTWTSAQEVIVTGLTELGASVHVNDRDVPLEYTRFTQTVRVLEGRRIITVTSMDAAGNSARAIIVVNVDLTPPLVMLESPADGGTVNESTPVLAGHLSDAGPVTLLVQGVQAFVGGDSWLATADLSEGPNVIDLTAVDAAGNIASFTFHLVVDTTPPQAQLTLRVDGTPMASGQGPLSTRAKSAELVLELGETCLVELPSMGERLVEAGESTVALRLVEGYNDLDVTVADAVGNGATSHFHVVRDTTPPALRIIYPGDGLETMDDWVTVVGVTEPGASLTVAGRPVTLLEGGNFSYRVFLQRGQNTFEVKAVDALGNEAALSLHMDRLGGQSGPARGVGAGGAIAALAILGVLGLVVLLMARGRRRAVEGGRTGRPRDAAPEMPPEAHGGPGVRVRRGR